MIDEWECEERSQPQKLLPVLVVPPAILPVSLVEAKRQCRVDFDDDDADIEAYLNAAIQHLDGYTGILGRALINQTWRQDFDRFCDNMRLPLKPLVSISSVTYYDANGVQQTLSPDVYRNYDDARGPFVSQRAGQEWPAVSPRPDAISVTFIAGYGSEASSVPFPLRSAIRLLTEFLYQHRGTHSIEDFTSTGVFERLVKPFRRVW